MTQYKKRTRSKLVTVIGVLLVLTSVGHMDSLTYFEIYKESFGFLPVSFIVIRYIGSWFQRIAGLLAGIGIICRHELSRRVILALSIFNIATAYWKHPYQVFYKDMVRYDSLYSEELLKWGMSFRFVDLSLTVTTAAMIGEVIVFSFLIWKLNQQSIRQEFMSNNESCDHDA